MKIEDIKPGLSLAGLEPAVIGSVVAVVPIAEGTVQVLYKTPDGTLKERLINRADEPNLTVATTERPWSFDGDGETFKLVVEAKRIDLAFLFDPMMAVHTSNVEALPHQITAVYESMLPRQPLRFVLADDPGAGKTIMAGLYIRYGDQPDVRARLRTRIDHNFDRQNLLALLDRNALAQETLGPERLFAVKEEMEKAEARRLQPYFVRSFFMKGFESLGGSIFPRELNRFEITHVPAVLRERDRLITGRNRRDLAPVLKRYERVCFTKDAVRPLERPGLAFANMIHPGHPVMLALSDVLLEQHANLLRQGSILVDPSDDGETPSLLFLLTHEVKSGDGQVISKRLQFVRVLPDGSATFAGWAPHLDLEPLAVAERPLLAGTLAAPWLTAGLEQRALALAASTLVPEHFSEIAGRRIAHVDKTLAAVHERLTTEINFWSDRYIKLSDDKAAGKEIGPNLDNVRRTIADLESRLAGRKKELQSMRHVTSATPVVLSGALVVPAGLLRKLRGETPPPDATAAMFSADPAARARIEKLAMDAVRRVEESRGCRVMDVSAQKCGWDITSYPQAVDGKQPEARHIEVKGRVKGAGTVTITRNEMLYALNQSDKFLLAIVLVGEGDAVEGPFYLRNPFDTEPGWGVSSVNYELNALLERAEKL